MIYDERVKAEVQRWIDANLLIELEYMDTYNGIDLYRVWVRVEEGDDDEGN